MRTLDPYIHPPAGLINLSLSLIFFILKNIFVIIAVTSKTIASLETFHVRLDTVPDTQSFTCCLLISRHAAEEESRYRESRFSAACVCAAMCTHGVDRLGICSIVTYYVYNVCLQQQLY